MNTELIARLGREAAMDVMYKQAQQPVNPDPGWMGGAPSPGSTRPDYIDPGKREILDPGWMGGPPDPDGMSAIGREVPSPGIKGKLSNWLSSMMEPYRKKQSPPDPGWMDRTVEYGLPVGENGEIDWPRGPLRALPSQSVPREF